jgi:hypothetical protein
MSMVHYHPDGWVYVRTPGATYNDKQPNVDRDFGVKLQSLPDGATERIYEQGVRHCLVLQGPGGPTIEGDVMPWPIGDDLIARVNEGLTAKENRGHIAVTNFDMGTNINMVITSGS